jgi:acyl-CoA synthetase (AMP-forming)/AMP-acid ligase II
MHLFDFFDKSAKAAPDVVAVVDEDAEVTYGELRVASLKLANGLRAAGLAEGARVATLMPNHRHFFTCQLGISRTPHVWLPLNARSTISENIAVMLDFNAQWLFLHSSFTAQVGQIRQDVPGLKGIVCIDAALPGIPALDAWIAPASADERPLRIDMQDCVAIKTTGGSTGRPKGVMRTSLSVELMMADYQIALPYQEPPINLVITPLTHAAGEVALPIFAWGGTQVILSSTAPQEILAAIARYRITTVFLPPTLIYKILLERNFREVDLGSLKYVMYGSAPMSVQKLKEAWSVFGPVLVQLYGLTEALSTLSIMTPAQHAEAFATDTGRLASCGKGGPSFVIEIVGPDGQFLRAREKGEIVCRSNSLMKGYYGNAAASAETIQEGWLHTGDIGFKDEAGYVYVVDRKKDIIISGAFNVYPGEVEQIVSRHPAINDCAVVGIPDEKWGEAVTAVVELKPGMALGAEELIAMCKEELGSIKAPKSVIVWDTLPRSNVGKVLKKEIRAHFWKDAGRTI